jgi:hypothetical protein
MLPPLLHPGLQSRDLKQTANQTLGPRHNKRVLNLGQSITEEGSWHQEVKSASVFSEHRQQQIRQRTLPLAWSHIVSGFTLL